MSAITGFTYTQLKARNIQGSPSVKERKMKLQAGDGVLTYPTGGIPVSKASLGLPNFIESIEMADTASPSGFIFKYDTVNSKILIYQSPAHTHTIPAGTDGAGGTSGAATPAALSELPNTATPTVNFNVIAKGY